MTRRTRAVCLVVWLLVSTAGCSTEEPDSGQGREQADCSGRIRAEGRTYTSYGFSHAPAAAHGTAVAAACHDTGADPDGSVFGEDSSRVSTWRLAGVRPATALGVRVRGRLLEVYVADSVAPADRARVRQRLASGS